MARKPEPAAEPTTEPTGESMTDIEKFDALLTALDEGSASAPDQPEPISVADVLDSRTQLEMLTGAAVLAAKHPKATS